MEILSCEKLSYKYNGCEKYAVKDVSFSVNSGEILLIMGKSGCGKTTLLRLLKNELCPVGEKTGTVTAFGKRLSEMTLRESAENIGFVMQKPDVQTVTDKVCTELAFGLENLGLDSGEIRRRVGEMASYFGIENIYRKEISTLSGGQKQLCSLCSAMVLSPELILLDEPTAQLDPVSAKKFISVLTQLNSELGTTIIIVEHNPEEIFAVADKVLVMEEGNVSAFGTPQQICCLAAENDDKGLSHMLPAAAKIFFGCKKNKSDYFSGQIPLTVREGKAYLESRFSKQAQRSTTEEKTAENKSVLVAENLWFRYERESEDILRGLDFQLNSGEIFTLVGSNGSGKTTLLKVLSGILKFRQGKITVDGKNIKSFHSNSLYKGLISVLPQNPYDLFTKQTVRADFLQTQKDMNCDNEEYLELCKKYGVTQLLDMHPYDLSGGEIQKCGLIKVLLTKPRILFLDEPSKALDPMAKNKFSQLLLNLKEQGTAICIVSHDIEFAAGCADRCGLFFDGTVCAVGKPNEFFSANKFYTTAARRISRNLLCDAVVCREVIKKLTEGDNDDKKSQA